MTLFKSPTFKAVSRADETEGDFRARLQTMAREKRDQLKEKMRKKYNSKITTLENRLRRAEQKVAREKEQSKGKQFDTVVSIGSALLGAFLGRKMVSRTNVRRAGSVIRGAGRMSKEASDVERAEASAQAVQEQLDEIKAQFEEEIEKIEESFDSQKEELKEIIVKPKLADIQIHLFGIGWAPHIENNRGRLVAAWANQ